MTTFKDYINQVTDLIGNTISNLFLTAAVAAFMLSIVSFILKRAKGADGEAIKDARNQLMWSVIALFVMFSIWGIIAFLQTGIFGPGGVKTQIEAPSIKVNTSSATSKPTNGSKKAGNVCTILAGASSECVSGFTYKS